MLAAQGRPGVAIRRLWRGYVGPLRDSLRDPAATHWMLAPDVSIEPSGAVHLQGQPARPDGSIPPWGAGIVLTRAYVVEGSSLVVTDRLAREEAGDVGDPGVAEVVYLVPDAARALAVAASDPLTRREPSNRALLLRPKSTTFFVRVTYRIGVG